MKNIYLYLCTLALSMSLVFSLNLYKLLLEAELENLLEKHEKREPQQHIKRDNPYVPYTATFYSKEQTNDNLPSSGVRGSTLKEAEKGYGLLQVSVNPNEIPLFTRLNLILWDQTKVEAIALDTGPSNTIDIYVDTNQEATDLGVKQISVEVLS